MTGRAGVPVKKHSIHLYMTLAIMLVIIIFISFFSIISYNEAREDLIEKNQALKDQTEKNILQSVILMDKGLSLFDATFDYQLKHAFEAFISEYLSSGNNPGKMNLQALKSRINEGIDGDIDIYIINESGVIEYTTFEPDLGLDFKKWPESYEFLTELRLGDNFSADRIVYGSGGDLRKFAYMPAPDHAYLLELGLISDSFKERRDEFNHNRIAEESEKLNPNLVSVHFFDSQGELIGSRLSKGHPSTSPEIIEEVSRVYSDEKDSEFTDRENETTTRYIYLDLGGGEYVSASEMSLVAQLVYTNKPLHDKLEGLFISHSIIAMLAIIIGILFAFTTSYHLTKPLRQIGDDIDYIAKGDLDYTVRGWRDTEYAKLESSINILVSTLKKNLMDISESEKIITNYSKNLEKMVEDRTEKLQKSSEEANLYLDILLHDMNVSNTKIVYYIQILMENLEGYRKQIADEALKGANSNAEIIRNVDIIRKLYDEKLSLKPMDLNQSIQNIIKKFPNTTIHYTESPAEVLANNLLNEVFSNIIANSINFGGPDIEIWLNVRNLENEVEVSIEDNGPGIPDNRKREIFNVFDPSKGKKYGKGLGLYVVNSIIDLFGGRIWADDRIKGQPKKGAAIHFTLRKAN